MKTFYINPETKDMEFDDAKRLKMIDGQDELIQCIERTFSTRLTEWFLNPRHGFDRFQILGKKWNRENVTQELYNVLLQEPRVERVESLSFEWNPLTRHLNIQFTIVDIDGNEIIGEV